MLRQSADGGTWEVWCVTSHSLAVRSVDGNTKSVANLDQAGDSLLNVLQKHSRGIIYQGNKEVVKESGRPKGHGLRKIIV